MLLLLRGRQRPRHAAGLAEGRPARRERQAAHARIGAVEARGSGEEALRVVGPRRMHEDEVAARQEASRPWISCTRARSLCRRRELPALLIVFAPSAAAWRPPAFARTTYRWKVLCPSAAPPRLFGESRAGADFASPRAPEEEDVEGIARIWRMSKTAPAKCPPLQRKTAQRPALPPSARRAARASSGVGSGAASEKSTARHSP